MAWDTPKGRAGLIGLNGGASLQVRFPRLWLIDICCSQILIAATQGYSSSAPVSNATPNLSKLPIITIDGRSYPTDAQTNISPSILAHLSRRLHLQPNHPISIARSLIESIFPAPVYTTHNDLSPIVTVHQNFDSLGFAPDHPGRSRTDTYYINSSTVLRTHTSAHQADIFRQDPSPGFLISADVYRRDAIDRSHYPVFHQMEGARMFDRNSSTNIVSAVLSNLATLPTHNLVVEDPNPPFHPDRNPLQARDHSPEEASALVAHLKHSLELTVASIFQSASEKPLRVRWIEAFFPFTSPSYEMEVLFNGEWLEILGCGIVQQSLPTNAGVPSKLGWAFGLGLERIAMILFGIPDIRLFWSKDPRFLSQFKRGQITRFKEFSKHPACYKDISFWLPPPTTTISHPSHPDKDTSAPAIAHCAGPENPTLPGHSDPFHENDLYSLVRDIAGDAVEDVTLMDRFTDKKTRRESVSFRINYRMLERTMTNTEANALHEKVRNGVDAWHGFTLR